MIDGVEVDEGLEGRAATAGPQCAVDLGAGVIAGANKGADGTRGVFDNDEGSLGDIGAIEGGDVGADGPLGGELEIEIEGGADGAAEAGVFAEKGVNKMRSQMGWVAMLDDGRGGQELALRGGYDACGGQAVERTAVSGGGGNRVAPGIEAGWSLGKAGKVDGLGQGEAGGGLAEVGAGGGFRAEAAIAVAGAVQVGGQDAGFVPAALEFDGGDGFAKFGEAGARL